MNWKDEKAATLFDDVFRVYNNGVTFKATFDIVGQSNGICAVLTSLGTNNGCAIEIFEGFKEQAIEAFMSELGIAVPDDYILNTDLTISYNDSKQQDIWVSFEWCESDLGVDINSGDFLNTRRITATFDKADLSENTGKLTQLMDSAVYTGEPSGQPELTKSQELELYEAAKRFFEEKGVKGLAK